MLVITTHAWLIWWKIYEWIWDRMLEILIAKKQDFLFLRHSIDGNLPSTLYTFIWGKPEKEQKLFHIRFSLFRYIVEFFSTVFLLWFSALKVDTFIGVDPLNAIAWIWLRRFGRVGKVIFYTADYSKDRFQNKTLNFVYHFIDRFCVKNADRVWSVSRRITDIRKDMELSDEKNIFVPNVPSEGYKDHLHIAKKEHSLITLGAISEQLDFENLFLAIRKLSAEYPDILLKIVWNGPKEEEYKRRVRDLKIERNVTFIGYLPHSQALAEIASSQIGLALYNGNWNFNYYGDSMKCREYFCFGLPVLTTNTHSTVSDIQKYKAGVVCEEMSDSLYYKAIREILDHYEDYAKNSRELGIKYEGIHAKLISELL